MVASWRSPDHPGANLRICAHGHPVGSRLVPLLQDQSVGGEELANPRGVPAHHLLKDGHSVAVVGPRPDPAQNLTVRSRSGCYAQKRCATL